MKRPMLEEILNNPDLQKYIVDFGKGRTLFLEGDDSQDLYILVSGHIDFLKGQRKISHTNEQGRLFGEISFLLGASRTATAKAMDDSKVIRIPKSEINDFLLKFPSVAGSITKILAERLDETSQILYGLEEFCDQLPDAVTLTDQEGQLLMWNKAAEDLYGRDWHDMSHKKISEIYEDPDAYRAFLQEVETRYAVQEKILKVRHPEKGTRYVSTSTTLLYDGQHNRQGVLSLGRDVTAVKSLEQKYRRARNWLIPVLILLALFSAGIFFGYPYFSKGYQNPDVKEQELRNQIAKDFFMLNSLLGKPFMQGDRKKTTAMMGEFFNIQNPDVSPYTGLILLDKEKKVFCAYSPGGKNDLSAIIGSSYAGIDFQGGDQSIHSVLVVYRTTKQHPMGHKGLEVAFKMFEADRFLGWLVFQMNVDLLKNVYGVNAESLKKFIFNRS